MDDLNNFNAVQARQNAESSKMSYDYLLAYALLAIKEASLNSENPMQLQYVKSSVNSEDLDELEAELIRRDFAVSKHDHDSVIIFSVSY